MTMYHDDINVMTDKGVMSGSLVFKIDDGELYCKYSYSDDSENSSLSSAELFSGIILEKENF